MWPLAVIVITLFLLVFINPPVHGVSSTPIVWAIIVIAGETFIGEDVAKQYVYKITASDNYSQPGDETNPTALIQIFLVHGKKLAVGGA